MEFVESFMRFVFNDEDVFIIENDPLVTEAVGVKSCECIVLINEKIALIEAKSSSPNPSNKEDFDVFIEDVKEKFASSLQLFSDIHKKQYGQEAFGRLPIRLRQIDITDNQYGIYLIIHGNEEFWMGGLQDALREALRDVIEKWNIDDINVKALNHTMAKELRLIVSYIPLDVLSSIKQPIDDTEQHRRNAEEWLKNNS